MPHPSGLGRGGWVPRPLVIGPGDWLLPMAILVWRCVLWTGTNQMTKLASLAFQKLEAFLRVPNCHTHTHTVYVLCTVLNPQRSQNYKHQLWVCINKILESRLRKTPTQHLPHASKSTCHFHSFPEIALVWLGFFFVRNAWHYVEI